MIKFIFKNIAVSAVLSFHLSSLSMIVSHKLSTPQRFKRQSDLAKTSRHEAFRDLKTAKQPLLLKDKPENPTLYYKFLPWEIQQRILALSDNKNGLKNTCWGYNEVLSKTTDNFKWIVELPHYPIQKKDVTFLMLEAVWRNRISDAETILQKTDQRKFKKRFSAQCSECGEGEKLSVSDIVDKKYNKEEYIALGRKYGSNFEAPVRHFSYEVDMLMAVYCCDRNRIKVCAKNPIEGWVVCRGFAFAIDQNNTDAIATLSSVVKSQENEYYFHVNFYELLKFAEAQNKSDIFELLVINDPFNCLNSVIPWPFQSFTILDGFVDKCPSSKYVDILRKHGARTYAELQDAALQNNDKSKDSGWCAIQ